MVLAHLIPQEWPKEEQNIAEELRSTGTVIQRTLPFACGMLGGDPRGGAAKNAFMGIDWGYNLSH